MVGKAWWWEHEALVTLSLSQEEDKCWCSLIFLSVHLTGWDAATPIPGCSFCLSQTSLETNPEVHLLSDSKSSQNDKITTLPFKLGTKGMFYWYMLHQEKVSGSMWSYSEQIMQTCRSPRESRRGHQTGELRKSGQPYTDPDAAYIRQDVPNRSGVLS